MKEKQSKLIDITTGEVLDIDSSDERLSDAYRSVRVRLKELEEIETALREAILARVTDGMDRYADYFEIQRQNRTRIVFPDKKIETEIKKRIDEIQKPFEETYELTILKFPKF